MNKPLSPISRSATILDFSNRKVTPYSHILVKHETPGAWHKPANLENQCYLIHWPDGQSFNLITKLALWQLQPSMVENAYKRSSPIHPTILADLYASIFDLKPRRKGVAQ